MPYPQWTDPEIIYGSDLNVLASQGIARFATAAERAAEITTPEKGQVTWVDGIGYQMFDGEQWTIFTVGPRLLAGKRFPGTDNLVLMPDNLANGETYTNMNSGPANLSAGTRCAVDAMVCVRTTIDNDVLRLTIREDDGDTHLTGLIVGFYVTWPLKSLTDYIMPLTFGFDVTEDMTRNYVVTAQRIAGSGEIWVRRRDLTTELASPHVSAHEVGRSNLLITA